MYAFEYQRPASRADALAAAAGARVLWEAFFAWLDYNISAIYPSNRPSVQTAL